MTRKRLEKIKGLSEVKVIKIKEAAAKVMVCRINCARTKPWTNSMKPEVNGFQTATDLAIKRKMCTKISTGSKQLDSILLG